MAKIAKLLTPILSNPDQVALGKEPIYFVDMVEWERHYKIMSEHRAANRDVSWFTNHRLKGEKVTPKKRGLERE